MAKIRVAVIGVSASVLAVIKSYLEESLEPFGFEKEDTSGLFGIAHQRKMEGK